MSEDTAATLESVKDQAYQDLPTDFQQQLSLVLFPETHTDKVKVFGKKRSISPLPIKPCKKLHSALKPVMEKIQKTVSEADDQDFDDEFLEAILDAGKILAEHYGWEDVKEAIEEDEIVLGEVQALLVAQTNLQGANDFLLRALQVVCSVMQMTEIQAINLKALQTTATPQTSTSIGQSSVTPGEKISST